LLEPRNNELVQNLIYAFTGIECTYLKKDIVTGEFKLDNKNQSNHEIHSSMLLRISEIGYFDQFFEF